MHAITIPQSNLWLQYFNRRDAVASVAAHIAALPSSRTEEKHTSRVYRAGMEYFFDWIQDELPTPDMLRRFVAHLVQKQLKSSTIASKYLAPVRHYLKRLADQHLPGYTGTERDFISDCRESIRQAAALPTPKPETTSNIAPLWRPEFIRLSINQVNAVLRKIDRSTIAGMRDYALLHIAFSTGLRLAEIARISLDSITPSGDGESYLLTVRGKRSNTDPVPISCTAHADLMAYVEAYNLPLRSGGTEGGYAPLPACGEGSGVGFRGGEVGAGVGKSGDVDPRLIIGAVPVWQPLHRNKFHFRIGRHNPAHGVSHQGIRDIIARHAGIAAHDTRRTAAAIAYDAGMPISDIQDLLRHKDAAVTMRYVGKKPNYHQRSLSTYVSFG